MRVTRTFAARDPFRGVERLAAVLLPLVGALLLGLGSQAGATTAPEIVTAVRITLTDNRVVFKPRVEADTNTTLAITVVNRATARRWFRLGWRKTHTLKRNGVERFYFSPHLAGRLSWSSGGSGRKLLRGNINVTIPKPLGTG